MIVLLIYLDRICDISRNDLRGRRRAESLIDLYRSVMKLWEKAGPAEILLSTLRVVSIDGPTRNSNI